MGYPGHFPLSHRLDARAEPLDLVHFGCMSKKTVGLGFANHNNNTTPILEKLDSEDEQEYIPNLTNQQYTDKNII